MDTINSNSVELKFARNRATITNYGKLLGQKILAVEVKNFDPEYNKRKQTNESLVPHFPIKIYGLKRIDVREVKVDDDAEGNLVIIFNGDSELRFPITSPELRIPSVATVKDAIAAFERKESTIFFNDCVKLTAELTALNKANYDKAIKLSRDMATQAEGLLQAMELDQTACAKYMSEIDSEVAIEITVTE